MPQHLQVDPSASQSAVPPPPRPALWRGVLRHHHFRWVWLGAMGSSVGTWMENVGVQWIMAEETGSTVMLGLLAAAQLGPILLLGVPAGLVVDWCERRALLLVTQAVLMAIAALLALASATGWATPGVLLALGLLAGAAMAFNTPAWQSLSPRLVPREELPQAIALMGLQFNLARVLGPAIAGALLASYSATLLFALNALSFVGVLLAVATTPPTHPPPAAARAPWREVREAVSFVARHPGARQLLLCLVLLSTFAAPLQRMLPLFVAEVYGASETTYGALLSAVGVGGVLGGLTLGRIPGWYPRHHLIPLSLTLSGLLMTLFCALDDPRLGALCVLASGLAWIWGFSSIITAVQLLTPDAMRGRVLALFNMATFGAMPIGSVLAALLGPWLAGFFGGGAALAVRLGVGVFTAALALAGLALLIWRTPEIDDLRPDDPGLARRPGLWRGLTAAGHRGRAAPR